MNINLFILLFVIILSSLSAEEIVGELSCLSHSQAQSCNVREGEFFNARLQVKGMHGEDVNSFQQFVGKTFLDYFYLNEIIDAKFSENNQDVLILDLDMVVKKKFEGKSFVILTFKSLNIPIDFSKLFVEKSGLKSKGFLLREEKRHYEDSFFKNNWYLIIVFLTLTIIFYFSVKYYRKRKEQKRIQDLKRHWINSIEKAETREEFEDIYLKREQWRGFFSGRDVEDFLKEIDNIQYKKSISEQELEDLKSISKEMAE